MIVEDMADVLHCMDRRGRLVVLPAAIWYDKILLDHRELHGKERSIELTVGDPDVHNHDKVHAEREVYYRLGALPAPYDRDYLKVVVAYSKADDGQFVGRVITAYDVEEIPRGERTIWTRGSHRRWRR